MRIPALLRERQFRRFWFGQTVSLFGDQVTLIALPLAAVLVLDAGPAQMGYLVAAELAPALLFSLHAGAWVDRRGLRRQTMIATDLGRAALIATIPLAYALDALTMEQLYVVAFLVGTLAVVFHVAWASLFSTLVRREQYVDASSLLYGSRAFSFVAGPSVGGVLVQVFRAPFALLVDAVSYLASAAFLARINPREAETEQAERGHVLAGLRYIRRTPTVLAALGATATINFFNFMFWALFVLYATKTLGVRPGTLGVVLGAAAIGGVIGSIAAGRVSRRIGIGPAFVFSCVLFPAPLVLVPLAEGPQPVVLAMLFSAEFLSGLGVMILDITAGAIFAAQIPERLRARVSGAYSFVNNGIRPLGSLAGGALGASLGLRPTLWIASLGALLGVLWLIPSPLPRLRELPEAAE
jgi:MFS family permease